MEEYVEGGDVNQAVGIEGLPQRRRLPRRRG